MRWRPQAGHLSGLRSSIRLVRAASQVIARPTPVVVISTPSRCGSLGMGLVSLATTCMWMRTEERVTPARIRNMRVELGRPQVGVAQHLLHRAQVGTPFEQVRGEGMAQQMGVDARRIEARLGGQAAQDEKRAGPCERTA